MQLIDVVKFVQDNPILPSSVLFATAAERRMTMREILFRGKRMGNGEWVEGDICHHDGVVSYIGQHPVDGSMVCYDLDPSTVGQYTGLKDKNGKKIFEGDAFQLDDECIGVIIFKDGCFRMQTYGMCGTWTESGYDECGGGWGVVECEPIDWYRVHNMEIIGNIHDNPELLGGC